MWENRRGVARGARHSAEAPGWLSQGVKPRCDNVGWALTAPEWSPNTPYRPPFGGVSISSPSVSTAPSPGVSSTSSTSSTSSQSRDRRAAGLVKDCPKGLSAVRQSGAKCGPVSGQSDVLSNGQGGMRRTAPPPSQGFLSSCLWRCLLRCLLLPHLLRILHASSLSVSPSPRRPGGCQLPAATQHWLLALFSLSCLSGPGRRRFQCCAAMVVCMHCHDTAAPLAHACCCCRRRRGRS